MNDDDDQFSLGQTLPPPDQHSILFEGPLKKKSPKSLAFLAWQERHVRITKDALFYYKKKDVPLTQYQGAIPWSCIERLVHDPKDAKKYRIDIHLYEQYNRQFSFIAKSEAEVVQWHRMIDQALEASRQVQRMGEGPVGGNQTGGGKIWKNKTAKTKEDGEVNVNKKGRNTSDLFDIQQRQMVEKYLNSAKPLYQHLAPQPRVNMFESLKVLANSLFGGYKIELEEQSLDLGSVYIVGNTHYPMTHQSYLIHACYTDNPHYSQALASMELLQICGSKFPLFSHQIHCGGTQDAVYSIYHPPLRSTADSLFAWLPKVECFPEEVVAWIAAHVVLTLDFLHNLQYPLLDSTLPPEQQAPQTPIQFPTLSPETIFFDAQGQVRICDLFLNPNPEHVKGIPEYSCPEVLCHNQPSTLRSDYWRLGVLLYELTTGLPPFRPTADVNDVDPDGQVSQQSLDAYKFDIQGQITSYEKNSNTISFPPTVSADLKDLILQFLQCDPNRRLVDQAKIRAHPFFVRQQTDINRIASEQYLAEFGFDVAQQQPLPPINLWDVFSLINAPKLPWMQKEILQVLHKDSTTPANLTFFPQPAPVQRLNVQLLKIRGLSVPGARLVLPKISCTITVEGDSQRLARPPSVSSLKPDVAVLDEMITFDLTTGWDLPMSSEIVIELYGPSGPQQPQPQAQGANPQQKTQSSKLFGLVTFPIYQVRNFQAVTSWLQIYDLYGMPIGEMEVSFGWEHEDIDLSPQTLGQFTDNSRSFMEVFGKPAPVPPRKLWASVIDISVLAQHESGVGVLYDVKDEAPTAQAKQDMYNATLRINPQQLQGATPGGNYGTIRATMIQPNSSLATPSMGVQQSLNSIYHHGSMSSTTPISMPQNTAQKQLLMPQTNSGTTYGSPSSAYSSVTVLGSHQTNHTRGNSSMNGAGTPVSVQGQSYVQSNTPIVDNTPPPEVPPLPPVPMDPVDSYNNTSTPQFQPSSQPAQSQMHLSTLNHQPNSLFLSTPGLSNMSSSSPSASSDTGLHFPSTYQQLGHTPTQSQPTQQPQPEPLPVVPAVPDLPPEPTPAPVVPPVPEPVPEPVPAPVQVDPNSCPQHWRKAKAPDGSVYFYNKVTKLTQWEVPECLLYPQ